MGGSTLLCDGDGSDDDDRLARSTAPVLPEDKEKEKEKKKAYVPVWLSVQEEETGKVINKITACMPFCGHFW